MVLGKLDSHMQNETGPFPDTIHKNRLKMDESTKCETRIHKNPKGEHRQQPLRPRPQQLLAKHVSKSKGNKGKNELLGLHQDKKLLHSKGNSCKSKRQPTEWEKIFASVLSDKVLVSKIYKELIKLNTQKTKKIQSRMGRRHEQTFLQRRYPNGQQTYEKMFNIT